MRVPVEIFLTGLHYFVHSARSLLAFALGLRPSKDIFWTHRPSNCHGNHTDYPQTCGRWGEHTNPGSNCELNALVATLSTGPVSLADKAGDTNATLVRRCIRYVLLERG